MSTIEEKKEVGRIIAEAKDFIEELRELDVTKLTPREFKEYKTKIKEDLKILRKSIGETRDKEERSQILDAIQDIEYFDSKMPSTYEKTKKGLSKAHLIISIIAFIAVFGWVGWTALAGGENERANFVRQSEIEGVICEDIFFAIDGNTKWSSGESDTGIEFVNVEFDAPMDLDGDGINELEHIMIQWHIDGEYWNFYTLELNGAAQNEYVAALTYDNVVSTGISMVNNTPGPKEIELASEQKQKSDNINVMNNPGDYLGMHLSQLEKEFGEYTVGEKRNSIPVKFGDKPFIFHMGFEDDPVCNVIIGLEGAEVMGLYNGITLNEMREVLGEPNFIGRDEEMTGDAYIVYNFDDYSISLSGDDYEGPMGNIWIK